MCLKGSATALSLLRGTISKLSTYHTDAYQLAVKNGFEGTIGEWLESLKGEKGDKGDPGKDGSGVTEIAIYDGSVEFTSELGSITGIDTAQITKGETYIVVWNGTSYACTAFLSGSMMLGNASLLGSGEDTGEPFCIEVLDGTSAYVYKNTSDAETVTLKVAYISGQLDWNQNDPTQPDYVKNRTHWAEGGMVEILPETALTADDEGMMLVTDEVSLTLGDTYVVVWNGTEYECVAQEFVDGDVTLTALGDVSVVSGGASTGEPFAIVRYPDEMIEEIGGIYLVILAVDGSATATLSIIHDAEIVRKLDNKYLDLDWLPIRKEVQLAAEKTVTSAVGTPTETTGGFPDLDNSMVYDGMPLVVYWDGVRYEVTVRYYNYNELEQYWFAGAQTGADVPFTLTFGSGSYVGDVYHTGRTNVSCDDDDPHVASVWGLGPNKLPREYLPDGVIPTKVSELENDAGYLTEHQSLDGYATETYVDDAIAEIDIPAGSVVVTVTQNDDNTYSTDMTLEEINAALDSGANVVAVKNYFVYALVYRSDAIVMFERSPSGSGYHYRLDIAPNSVAHKIIPRFLGNALTINGTAYDGSKPVTLEIESGTVTDEQIATAVDAYMAENPVEVPNGDGGQFRFIRTVTIPEDVATDTSGVNFAEQTNGGVLFGFSTDENGEPFSVSELMVFSYAGTDHTSSDFTAAIDSDVPSYGNFAGGIALQTYLEPGKSGEKAYSCTYSTVFDDGGSFGYGTSFNGGINTMKTLGKLGGRVGSSHTPKIEKIRVYMNNLQGYGYTAGSTFTFYGR